MFYQFQSIARLFAMCCLLFVWITALKAQHITTSEGFTPGTTVTLQLDENKITRSDWEAMYGPIMPGTVSVSKKGTTGANEIKIYGRRDGTLPPLEVYWSMSTQTITFGSDQVSGRVILPFGPSYNLQPEGSEQDYKYTAILQAGTETASSSAFLKVVNGGDGLCEIIDETL